MAVIVAWLAAVRAAYGVDEENSVFESMWASDSRNNTCDAPESAIADTEFVYGEGTVLANMARWLSSVQLICSNDGLIRGGVGKAAM
jgi:hypothetical protein